MKKMKQLLSVMLCVALFLTLMPMRAFAEDIPAETEVLETEPASEALEVTECVEDDEWKNLVTAFENAETEEIDVATIEFPSMNDSGVATYSNYYTYYESEPNNKMSTANRIYDGYMVSGQLSNYDVDYFKLVVPTKSKIEVVSLATKRSMYISLFNSKDKAVKVGTDLGSEGKYYADAFTVTVEAGTYYVVTLDSKNYSDIYTFSVDVTSLHTHYYSETVVAPTCVSEGYTLHKCSCGDTYKSDYISATGEHLYEEKAEDQYLKYDATCTEAAVYYKSCSVCGAQGTDTFTAGEANGHNYENGICTECGQSIKRGSTPMYRLFNPNTGEHFYTGSAQERDNLVAAGWDYEGIAWNAPVSGGTPIHRLFNPNSGDHHYSGSMEEVENLVAVGWQYEGVAFNSAPSTRLPQYRMYNPNADLGSHHYTGSAEERDFLVSVGWKYEGIGWYGMP